MVAKLSSVNTISAASLVTSVPLIPIAMPTSARFSAGASFTRPRSFRPLPAYFAAPAPGGIYLPGWFGQRYRILRRLAQLVVVHRLQLAPGNGARRVANTQHLSNAHRRLWMIPGNHFHANARLQAVGNGRNGFRARGSIMPAMPSSMTLLADPHASARAARWRPVSAAATMRNPSRAYSSIFSSQ